MFALEPSIGMDGLKHRFNCEDNVVVTSSGCEIMNAFLRCDLRVRA